MFVYFHDPFGNQILINDTTRKHISIQRNKFIRDKVLQKYEKEKRNHFDIIRNSITNAWIEKYTKKDIQNFANQKDISMSRAIKVLRY